MSRSQCVPGPELPVFGTRYGRSDGMQASGRSSDDWSLLTAVIAIALVGCGGSNAPQPPSEANAVPAPPAVAAAGASRAVSTADVPPPPAEGDSKANADAESTGIVPASLSQAKAESEKNAPEPGSPEGLLQQLIRLRTAPMDVVRQPIPDQPGKFEEVHLTPSQVAAERSRRYQEISDLASQLIAKTHDKPALEQLFNSAVSMLTESRMQMVLSGDKTQARYLIEDADALYKRDPTSFAAIEAGYRTVQLAQSLAQLQPDDPELAVAYSRRSRLFAERFPQETSRAAVSLMTAARQCDHLGLIDEARLCYAVVSQQYSDTPFAGQVSGPLRRFQLVGQVLEDFAGETHDGGQISLSQYRGHVVLIAFWSSASRFSQDLPTLEQIAAKYSSEPFQVLGVNLDQELAELEETLESGGLGWKHIFFLDPQLRGLANPLARHYGVTKVPLYWLVDANGVVRSIDVAPANLEDEVGTLLSGSGS